MVVRTSDAFDVKTFDDIDRLAGEFEKIKGVRRVISLPGIKRDMDVTKKWTLTDFKRVIAPVALLEKNIISKDGKTTVISLILEDIKQKDPVITEIQALIEREKARQPMYQIGMPVVSMALARFTENDFIRLPPIAFLLIMVTLFLLFRNLRGVLIPSGSVLIALIWTFGLMALTGTPLSLLIMIVPIFLIAVGTAYCMYIFPEYALAQETCKTPRDASLNCFFATGFSNISGRLYHQYRAGLPSDQ